MAIYFFWGEDDFALGQAVAALRDRTVDPDWASFNYDKLSGDQAEGVVQTLNLAMTPVFGAGRRLVWLADTTLAQRCPDDLLGELERTLPVLPETTVLLLTSTSKMDGRLKSTKLLQKVGEIREFSPISPWKTDLLIQNVRQVAQVVGVKLTPGAIELLAEAVGNNSRQLYSEMEKLRLYGGASQEPVSEAAVVNLVTAHTQNSLQLAIAIRQGDTAKALTLVADLFSRNEPGLRIVATLVGQFRTRLWIKLLMESGERDEREIARLAEIGNPKQVYFLQKEVKPLRLASLQKTMPILMELEFGLKLGADPLELMQMKVMELCQLYV
ncbi:MAG: DNA polymerase III subunit delta [Leptolyngbyaceae cyanobacterium CSU_1_4]|nr:DNA polymerase III subunit delta [Leptolyngbyaceae cyanobacterium CSU_1_4]